MKRYVVTTMGNVYLNDFDEYEYAYHYCAMLDIKCKLNDTLMGAVVEFTEGRC